MSSYKDLVKKSYEKNGFINIEEDNNNENEPNNKKKIKGFNCKPKQLENIASLLVIGAQKREKKKTKTTTSERDESKGSRNDSSNKVKESTGKQSKSNFES